MIWAVIWYYLLAVFTAADIITTKLIIILGGHEWNPYMARVLDHFFEIKIVFLLVMIVLIVCAEIVLSKLGHGDGGWAPAASAACATFGCVLSNIIQIAMAI